MIFFLSSEGNNRYWPEINPASVQKQAGERIAVEKLLQALRQSSDLAQRKAIVDILYRREGVAIAETFRSLIGSGDNEASYWMACYLGAHGDGRALEILHEHYGTWPVSSLALATAARLFGDRLYYPAAPELIESLDAASLNLAGAALKSLMKLYPGAKPGDIDSPAQAQSYYRRRAVERL